MIKEVTFPVFIEQIQRRLQNDFPSAEFTVTDNEIALYVYQALASAITAAANQAYSVEGVASLPESFTTTFKFKTFKKDYDTNRYSVTLPHPPLNLLQGYSILAPFLAGQGRMSEPLIKINGYQKGYALKLISPGYGVFYEVEGNQMILTSEDLNLSTAGLTLYVPMLSPRGNNGETTLNASDETLALVFDQVIARLTARVATPKDTTNDGANKRTEA